MLYGIMIGNSNHYGSRFAAEKAVAAFRLAARTSGNPADILWYTEENQIKKEKLQ